MATTFVFEELDDATRNYLLEVRKRDGRGSPGVYIPGSTSMPLLGCLLGPVIVVATLLITLLSGVVLNSPFRVAMLQTAGVMLGGWMFVAAFRVWAAKNSARVAGNWVYADPQFIYQAAGEQVTVTPANEITDARATHNYQNGAYQNTAVGFAFAGAKPLNLTLNHEKRAEAMVIYYNYLVWARGPEGGGRANLPPALLGGVAKYVAKNGDEPKEADGQLNFNLVELELTDVPEEPKRDGRAGIHVLPYLGLLVFSAGFFLAMWAVNGPFHDEAVYVEVTRPPVMPLSLREYLVDPANTLHRDDVARRLAAFYEPSVQHVEQNARDPELRRGMVETLKGLQAAEAPAVAVRVTEEKVPAGAEADAAKRAEALRTKVVKGVTETFTEVSPGFTLPPDTFFTVQPPSVGDQLVYFAEAAEGKNPHFDITYRLTEAADKTYSAAWTVSVRLKVEDDQPLVSRQFTGTKTYPAAKLDQAAEDVAARILEDLVGPRKKPAPAPNNPFGGVNIPGLNIPQ